MTPSVLFLSVCKAQLCNYKKILVISLYLLNISVYSPQGFSVNQCFSK